ncbi:MAG TPA: hypothetical protein VD887_07530 [Allosphingosinicella sp.]|nr:hypothetical protein [Allosphingosinicella sp.]
MGRQYEALVTDPEFAADRPSADMSVYVPKLQTNFPNFDVPPSKIFFYYAEFVGSAPSTKCYYYNNGTPIPYRDVEQHIVRMAQAARGGTLPACSTACQDCVDTIYGAKWPDRNYFVLLMDDPNWRLAKRLVDGLPAIEFDLGKGSTPNHTFFDGKDIDVDVDATEVVKMRSVFYMVNHWRRNAAGDPIPRNYRQDFVFNIHYTVTRADGGTTTMIDDPTGTNLGPPL